MKKTSSRAKELDAFVDPLDILADSMALNLVEDMITEGNVAAHLNAVGQDDLDFDLGAVSTDQGRDTMTFKCSWIVDLRVPSCQPRWPARLHITTIGGRTPSR